MVWRLSDRQLGCLVLVAEGKTSKEIARHLEISPSTVDNHIGAAIERLGCTNRSEAAQLVREHFPDSFPGTKYPALKKGEPHLNCDTLLSSLISVKIKLGNQIVEFAPVRDDLSGESD